MDMFFGAVKAFFDTFSAVVFVPMIMFVINLAFKVKPKKAFMCLSRPINLQISLINNIVVKINKTTLPTMTITICI